MTPVLAVIPVKPFGVAKARLSGMLDAAARSRLGKAMAQRTAEIAGQAGAEPVIVTGDAAVTAWARGLGLGVLAEQGDGLDGAATTGVGVATRGGRRWLVVHADLPLVRSTDLVAAIEATPADGCMLAPAIDGGTNVIGGSRTFPFRYGPGSFHRHLRSAAARGPVAVVARPGLALDLDRPTDLTAAARLPAGSWLAPFLHAGAVDSDP